MIEENALAVEAAVPGCQICGRQDETVRLVTYPFAFSVVLFTFRRAFHGVWCARHRRWNHLLAILITATVGWMGVPFGLIYAPITLIQLALGGTKPKEANEHMLRAIGDDKARSGDFAGALRCYEAALQFSDDPELEAEIRRITLMQSTPRQEPASSIFLTVLTGAGTLLVLAFLIGLGAGVLDDLIVLMIGQVLGQYDNIFLVILSWIPELLLGVLGIFLLKVLYDWIIDRLHVTIDALAGALAITASLLFMYALLAGEVLDQMVTFMVYQPELFVRANLLRDIFSAILRGGVQNVAGALAVAQVSSTIQVIVTVLLTAYAVFTLTSSGSRSTAWRARLAAITPHGRYFRMPAQPALVAMVAVPVMLAGLALSLPQKGFVDSLQAAQKMQVAYELYGNPESDPAEVERALQEVIQLNPGITHPRIVLANLYFNSGRLDDSEAELKTVEAMDPDNAGMWVVRGFISSARGETEAAREAYERSIRVEPGAAAAYAGLGWLDLYEGLYENARANFEKALALNPQSMDALGGMGMLSYYEYKIDDAIEKLSEVLRQGGGGFEYESTLVYAYLMVGKHELAATQARLLLEHNPGHTVTHAILALAYNQAGQIEQRDEQLGLALQAYQDPVYSDGEYGATVLATVLANSHRFAEAELVLNGAIPASQQNGQLYLILARVFTGQGRYEEALAALENAGVPPGEKLVAQSAVYFAKGDFERARDLLLQALSQDAGNSEANNDLVATYFYLGNHAEALRIAEGLLAELPYSYDVLTFQSLSYRALEQVDEAAAAGKRAVELAPGYDLAHYAYGMALADGGQVDLARPELERFLALYWDRPYARAHKAEAEGLLK